MDRAAVVARACRLLDDEDLPLVELAAQVGMSPHHLHRTFKAHTGLTPKAYAMSRRAERARRHLEGGASVTQSMYDAGFGSVATFYTDAPDHLGMTPTQYRDGAAGERIRVAVGECSLGSVLVAATDRGVCSIRIGDEPDALVREFQDRFPHAEVVAGDAEFDALVARVVALVEHPAEPADLPLDIRGTTFQARVWDALRRIPVGATATYTEIAAAVGRPSAVRAVAGACAANELAVAIPCHRVVRTDGSLSGYRWGVERKAELLAREASSAAGGSPLSARTSRVR